MTPLRQAHNTINFSSLADNHLNYTSLRQDSQTQLSLISSSLHRFLSTFTIQDVTPGPLFSASLRALVPLFGTGERSLFCPLLRAPSLLAGSSTCALHLSLKRQHHLSRHSHMAKAKATNIKDQEFPPITHYLPGRHLLTVKV